MAFGSIEFTTISRAQDYSTVKQNEDNHASLQQNLISSQNEKTQMRRMRDVNEADDSRWTNEKFDARDKGKQQYQGNGGRNRQKKETVKDQVLPKQRTGFDMKV